MRTRGGYPTNRLIVDHGDWQEWDVSTRACPAAVLKINTADMLKLRETCRGRIRADLKNGPIYARIIHNESHVYVHRLLLGVPAGMLVDHINHDGLDNRRGNLRVVTSSENRANHVRYATNSSGVVGVHWSKKRRKWETYLNLHGKRVRLGHFADKADAIAARRAAEQEHFGEFAYAGAQS